jgi:hypothetical protein
MMSYLESLFSLRGKNALVTGAASSPGPPAPLHSPKQEHVSPWSTSIRLASQRRQRKSPKLSHYRPTLHNPMVWNVW